MLNAWIPVYAALEEGRILGTRDVLRATRTECEAQGEYAADIDRYERDLGQALNSLARKIADELERAAGRSWPG
jgi:hypothetical protein